MPFFLLQSRFVMSEHVAGVYLNHAAEGHSIRCQFVGSHSCVDHQADRHSHTYLYNGLHFTVRPRHPCRLFLATVSLALLFFPPTPLHCASLLLPMLSCYKSSSFPLSLILPVPTLSSSFPFPSFSYFLLMFARMSGRCLLQMPSCSWKAVVSTA